MMSITCIASSPPFVSRYGGRRMGGTNGRAAAEGQHCLFPVWTPGRQFGRLDAARVPKSEGAPRLPFCAARATPRAGNPLTPSRWTRRGLRLRLWSCSALRDWVSRACGLGAGAMPPSTLPARWRASDGLGHQRLLAPPRAFHRPCWGTVRFQGLRAAMPLPHARPAAWRGSPSSFGYRPTTALLWLAAFLARTVARPCEASRLNGRDCPSWRQGGAFHPTS